MADIITIGIFYDGGFLRHINEYYYTHHVVRSRIDLGALHEFIRQTVSKREGVAVEKTRIFDKCYFSGRYYTKVLADKANGEDEKLLKLLRRERFQEDELFHHSIQTFYLEMKDIHGRDTEKGIDSLMSLKTYVMSTAIRYNYVVLVTGDGDYVSLTTELRPLGCQTLLLGWDFKYVTQGKTEETYTSRYLKEAVTCSLDMTSIIENGLKEDDPLITALFRIPEKKVVQISPSPIVAPTAPGEYFTKEGVLSNFGPNFGLIKVTGERDYYRFDTKNVEILAPDGLRNNDEVEFTFEMRTETKPLVLKIKRTTKPEPEVSA